MNTKYIHVPSDKKAVYLKDIDSAESVDKLSEIEILVKKDDKENTYYDEDMILSIKKALEARWELNQTKYKDIEIGDMADDKMKEAYNELVNAELVNLKDNYKKVAKNPDISRDYNKYYEEVLKQSNSINNYKIGSSSQNKDWDSANYQRRKLVNDFISKYGLKIDSKYNETLDEFISLFNPDNTKKELFKKIDGNYFQELARNGNNHKGEKIILNGKVIQIIEPNGGQAAGLRVTNEGRNDEIIYISIHSDVWDKNRLLEGESATFYIIFHGLTTYNSTLGANITIPSGKCYIYDRD